MTNNARLSILAGRKRVETYFRTIKVVSKRITVPAFSLSVGIHTEVIAKKPTQSVLVTAYIENKPSGIGVKEINIEPTRILIKVSNTGSEQTVNLKAIINEIYI